MQRDPFGNTFYINRRSSVNRNVPKPISTDELLDIRPSESWLERVSDGLRPKLDMVVAQLLLKVSSEAEAFPFIEALAETHPDRARELVEEFLRVWAKNHDPNSDNRRRNSYVYFYGFEQRANAIPLTRSKQERNLAELSEWIRRLRELPIEGVDESLIANAFVAAHSTAEVYRSRTSSDRSTRWSRRPWPSSSSACARTSSASGATPRRRRTRARGAARRTSRTRSSAATTWRSR